MHSGSLLGCVFLLFLFAPLQGSLLPRSSPSISSHLLLCATGRSSQRYEEVDPNPYEEWGCDGVLDECGVCNGNGSTCAQVESYNSTCDNLYTVPNFFWDWLLFPVAVDDLISKLQSLSSTLGDINTTLGSIEFDQIPQNSTLDFVQLLQANYEWLSAEDYSQGGALVPFTSFLWSVNNRLLWALEEQNEYSKKQ